MKLTCKQASRMISEGLDKELPPAARATLHMHLAVCAACRRLERQFGFLRQALSAYAGRNSRRDSSDDGEPRA
jgi:predicted anti-sigma-YlaC factor YlaD